MMDEGSKDKPKEEIKDGVPLNREQFKTACFVLWDLHIRTNLVYSKNLVYCRPCFAFFYLQDSQADHPKEQAIVVQKYCTDNLITSGTILDQALWKDARLMYKLGQKVYHPTFNPSHRKPNLEGSINSSQVELRWHQSRVLAIEKELSEVINHKKVLEQENCLLKEMMDALLQRSMKEQSMRQEERMKVEILIAGLSTVYSKDK